MSDNQTLVKDARQKLAWGAGFLAYWNGHPIPRDAGEAISKLCMAVVSLEYALARTALGECASQSHGDWPRCSDQPGDPIPILEWCAGCQLAYFLSRASWIMESFKAGDSNEILWGLISEMAETGPVNVPHSPRPGEVYAYGPTQEAR